MKTALGVLATIGVLFGIGGTFSPASISDVGSSLLARLLPTRQLGEFEIVDISSECVSGVPRISLSWTESSGANSYLVYRQYPWGTWEDVGGTNSLSFTDTTFEPGYDHGVWSYRIETSLKRAKQVSNTVTITLGSCDSGVPPVTPTSTPTSTTPAAEPTPVPPAPAPTSTPTSTPATGGGETTPAPSPTSTPTSTTPAPEPTSVPPAPAPTSTPTSTPASSSTPTAVIPGNLVQNSSLEDDRDENKVPDYWFKNSWGRNNPSFSYPVPGIDGVRAASLSISSYSSGDAKWYFADIPVTPGKTYRISDWYLSSASSQMVIRYTKSSGGFSYVNAGTIPASASWRQFSGTFTPPNGVVSATGFHLLAANGSLTVDAFTLLPETPGGTPAPAPAPTLTLTASPSSFVGGGTATLTWSAVNADSCTASGAWSGQKDSTGNQTIAVSQTGTYTLTCAGAGGQVAKSVTITVTPAPQTPTSTAPIPTSTPTSTPSTGSGRVLWGAYPGELTSDAAALESLVGKSMDLQATFVGWGSSGPFPSELRTSVRDKGKTLVIFWESYGTTLDDINAGNWDSYLAQFAASAKTYAGPVILAPFHEMNGNWDPWGGTVGNNTPAKVIAAWRRVHGFFGGITNVKFAWDVNNVSVPNTSANSIGAYYPGDAYTDYVAVDGFNFGSPWESFGTVFSSALDTLKQYGKPIYILSMASTAGSQKAAWITDAFSVQLPKHPEVVGWVWFNVNKERDWRVNSDASSLTAFKAILP